MKLYEFIVETAIVNDDSDDVDSSGESVSWMKDGLLWVPGRGVGGGEARE